MPLPTLVAIAAENNSWDVYFSRRIDAGFDDPFRIMLACTPAKDFAWEISKFHVRHSGFFTGRDRVKSCKEIEDFFLENLKYNKQSPAAGTFYPGLFVCDPGSRFPHQRFFQEFRFFLFPDRSGGIWNSGFGLKSLLAESPSEYRLGNYLDEKYADRAYFLRLLENKTAFKGGAVESFMKTVYENRDTEINLSPYSSDDPEKLFELSDLAQLGRDQADPAAFDDDLSRKTACRLLDPREKKPDGLTPFSGIMTGLSGLLEACDRQIKKNFPDYDPLADAADVSISMPYLKALAFLAHFYYFNDAKVWRSSVAEGAEQAKILYKGRRIAVIPDADQKKTRGRCA